MLFYLSNLLALTAFDCFRHLLLRHFAVTAGDGPRRGAVGPLALPLGHQGLLLLGKINSPSPPNRTNIDETYQFTRQVT